MKPLLTRALLLAVLVTQAACVSSSNTQRKPSSSEKIELAQTNLQLGIGYLQQGKLDIAQQKLLAAIELAPDLMPAYSTLAIVAEQQGKMSEAEGYYRKSLRLDSASGISNNNYGAFLCKQQRYQEALEHYDKAVQDGSYPTPDSAYENAGICAMQADKAKVAEGYFRKALELNPGLAVSLIRMAKLNYDAGRYLPARAYMQRFEEVGQHGPATLLLAKDIEQSLGNVDFANDYANRLKHDFPDADETARLVEANGTRKK